MTGARAPLRITTPVVVLRFEADTPEALARIQEDFRRALTSVWPGVELPF